MAAYFNQEFVEFFKELTVNNHKEWFDDNRKRYTKFVKEPFYDLVGDLLNDARKIDSNINIPVKDAVFRINRDVRFSKDKSPYNLHLSAIISAGGRKDMQVPGMYCRFSIGETSIGCGNFMPDKEKLMAIRKKLIGDLAVFESLVKAPQFAKLFGEMKAGEMNKILPKEIKAHGESTPIIFNKQYYFMKEYEGAEVLLRDDLRSFIMKHFEVGYGVNQYLTV